MSYTYDFELLASKDKFKKNLLKLMSSSKEALTLNRLIKRTGLLEDRVDILQLCHNSTVNYSWQITSSLSSVDPPDFDLVLDGMKANGVVDFILEVAKQFLNDEYVDINYSIKCQLEYTFSDNSVYRTSLHIGLSFNAQGLYGNPSEDINLSLSLINGDMNNNNRFCVKNKIDFESIFTKSIYMYIVETLEVKYAFFKPETQTFHIRDIEIGNFTLPSVNILKPWKRFKTNYELDTAMIYGRELVTELGLNKVDWEMESIYYLKWLDSGILWLNSPREIVERGSYQIPPEKRSKNLKHFESLDRVIPDSLLKFGDVRKLVMNENGKAVYQEGDFRFEYGEGFVFEF